ncbi:hypothetical protein Tco_0855106 [Tanacetum coccineum]
MDGCRSVDDFACPALFPWHTAKNVTRDPAPAAADFNAHDYATLVAHPSPTKRVSVFYYIYVVYLIACCFISNCASFTPDPTKVKVVKRERVKDRPRLLETIVGRIVPLLLVAPDHVKSELEASVDKLFDEGGSGNQAGQGDFPRRQRKRKAAVVDAGETSHPPKTLREDNGTQSGASVGGKSRYVVQWLLARAVLNAEVRGEPIPTLPLVTSSVSPMPGVEVDSLMTSSAPVITIVTIVTLMVDTAAVAKEKPVEPSLFGDASSSSGRTDPTPGGFSDLTGIVGGIHTNISPDTNLQKFAPPNFFASIREMKHEQLFTKFNVGAARQISLSAEVRMRVEYNIREKRRLKTVNEEQAELLKVREKKVEDLKAQLLLKEEKVVKAIHLHVEASKFKTIEKSLQDEVKAMKERNASLEKEQDALDVKVTGLEASFMGKDCELSDLNAQLTSVKSHNDSLVDQVELELKTIIDKFDKMHVDFVEMALHLEEKFYPHILTTIFGRRWLLTHGMKLVIIKCLNSPKYLSALGAAIGKAIEKGMQDGLATGIMHGKEGTKLTDLQDVNFSLLADLKSNKDASVEMVMNILRLEDPLAEKLRLSELQPHVDQLMVLIHRSTNQAVLGAFSLSLALDVSSSRVWKIMENIANHRSALSDVFVPLAEPLSVTALTCTEGTSNVILATADTTTALSITFASASTITPIFVYDYEVMGTDN